MPRKVVAGIDRKSLYIPEPGKWEWKNLTKVEVDKRLAAARDTVQKLQDWLDGLALHRERKRAEVWESLRNGARLTEYSKTGGWKVDGQTELENLGKEMAVLEKLLAQCNEAIESVEKRRQVERLA